MGLIWDPLGLGGAGCIGVWALVWGAMRESMILGGFGVGFGSHEGASWFGCF